MTTVSSLQPRPAAIAPLASASARRSQWYWLGGGLAMSFLIPFVFTDLISIDRDLYYGLYVVGVVGFLGAWLCTGSVDAREVVTRNWRLGILLGVAFIAVMVAIVLNEPSTTRPDGLELALAIVWRGILYGFVDGLILSAFPIVAVFAAFAGTRLLERLQGKVAVGALALAVSLLFTAVYHAGYTDFRGEKLRKPLVGDTIWSLPTLLTLSPLGSPITHAGLHVAAVVHSYETDTFLPPHAAGLDPAPLQLVLDEAVSGPDRLAPGAVAYVSAPEGTWTGAAGLANVATAAAMTIEARMRLESVSKIWTAVLIHQLAEDGALSLGDAVSRWLPGALPDGDRITLTHLLTHTSGPIHDGDVVDDPDLYLGRVGDPVLRARLFDLKRKVEANPFIEFPATVWVELAAYQPLLFEPGTQFHYSNIGFDILGLIAVEASGQSLEALHRERIFDPLGLEQTAYDPQGPIHGS